MAVNLSPIWGAGAQLLDNSGNVLSGGKIYTYAAGTTTPAATYTSSNGITANSNPIILNSAGRVPYEIWLTDGISYKFVLKDSNDVLIATYDNLTGINSNFIAYTAQQEIQTATAGQTVFNLTTMQYQPGTNNLSVFVDGVNQYGPGAQYAYVETDSDTVTFVSGLHVGASVKFTTATPVSSSSTNAENVAYDPPFTGAVATNVEAKLSEYVSVKDFGAVGDGVTDDTAAIQAAIDYAKTNFVGIYLPQGTYKATSEINLQASVGGGLGAFNGFDFFGDGQSATTLLLDFDGSYGLSINRLMNNSTSFAGATIGKFTVKVNTGRTIDNPIYVINCYDNEFSDIIVYHPDNTVTSSFVGFRVSGSVYRNVYRNIQIYAAGGSGSLNAGTAFRVGNGYIEANSDYAATNIGTWENCYASYYAVGFDIDAAEAQTLINCDMEVNGVNYRLLGAQRSQLLNCWDEGGVTYGVAISNVTVAKPSGSSTKTALANIIENGFYTSIYIDYATETRVRTRANSYTTTANSSATKIETLTSGGGGTFTGKSQDVLVSYSPSSPFNYNALSLGNKRYAYEFPDTTGTARWMWSSTGDSPIVNTYRTNGAGSYCGYSLETIAPGGMRVQAWTTGGISAEVKTQVADFLTTKTQFSVPVQAQFMAVDGSLGATGSFTSADGKTVTVKNGIVTSIV